MSVLTPTVPDERISRVPALKEWFDRLFSRAPSRDSERHSPEFVLTKHAGTLMRVRGVMSIGVGRDESGRSVIIVGVVSDAPDAVGELPETLDGVPVVKRTS